MKTLHAALSIIFLLVLAATAPVLAGGWAVITLEELPAGAVAGEPITIRFAVRQHGRTLLKGLEASVHGRNTSSGETLAAAASPVTGQPGYYQAEVAFPSAGAWEWSIQAFTMDQLMPDLKVLDRVPASLPAPPSSAAIAAGASGLLLAGAAVLFARRKRARWAAGLVILGLAIGGAGFAAAAGQPGHSSRSQPAAALAGESPASLADTGKALFVSKGCVTCHTNTRLERKYTEMHIDIGPDLTRFNANPDYLRMWLADPGAVKKDTGMPDLDLDEAEIEALIAFINAQPTSQVEQSEAARPVQAPIASPPDDKPAGQNEACRSLKSDAGMLAFLSRNKREILKLYDPASGLPLCGYEPVDFAGSISYVFSPDRLSLAVLSTESPEQDSWRLHLVDLLAWKVTDTGVVLPAWSTGMAVHPDRSRVAAVHALLTEKAEPKMLGYRLVQVDASGKGKPSQSIDLDFAPRLIAYSRGGQHILLYGIAYDFVKGTNLPLTRVALFNSSDLSLDWEAQLDDVLEGVIQTGEGSNPDSYTQWQPALALAPDGEKLYVVHADADRLTTINLVQHSYTTVDIQPRLSWFERLLRRLAGVAHAKVLNGTTKHAVLSLDGAYLYVSGFTGLPSRDERGDWQFETQPFGIQMIDVGEAREVARLETPASDISLSAGGAYLFLRGWEQEQAWTDVIDSSTLAVVRRLDRQHLYPAATLSGDGLVLSDAPRGGWVYSLEVLDVKTFAESSQLDGTGFSIWAP